MLLSIVFFMTGLLGFLTFAVVVSQYKTNRKVNFYLLVLILVASFRFFFNGISTLISFLPDKEFINIFRPFTCLVFACIYLYFRCLVVNRKNPVLGDLYYFILPVLFGFASLLIRNYAISFHLVSYILYALIPLFYLLFAYNILDRVWFNKAKRSLRNNQKVFVRNWAIFFFTFCVLVVVRLEVSLFFDMYVSGFSDGNSFLWVSAILCGFLFFKILMTPTVLHVNSLLSNTVRSKEDFEIVFDDLWIYSGEVFVNDVEDLKLQKRLEENLENYIYGIESMALEQFCFRNPYVSMGDFAIKLEIPKSHLIYFFKYHSNVSFIEFKRTVRIYDAISLIEEGYLESASFESLSEKTGFASYDVFIDTFKEVSGVLPSEYLQKRKEVC